MHRADLRVGATEAWMKATRARGTALLEGRARGHRVHQRDERSLSSSSGAAHAVMREAVACVRGVMECDAQLSRLSTVRDDKRW